MVPRWLKLLGLFLAHRWLASFERLGVLHSFLTVALSYVPVVLTHPRVMLRSEGPCRDCGVFLFTVLFFSASHAVLPAFVAAPAKPGKVKAREIAGLAAWYGPATLIVSVMTKGVQLVGPLVHVLLAPRGYRRWRALQYATTNFALFLVLLFAYTSAPFPAWIFFSAALGQAMLLTAVEHWAKRRWLPIESRG